MKQKIAHILFLGAFLALCLLPSLGLLAAGPSEAGANEQLSEAPVLTDEEGKLNTDYLSDLSGWVNDRFFLRQELISADRWISAHILGTSGESGVILGSEGWLFYADTLNDYAGADPMTDRELFSAAKNLSLMAEYCRENGREFLFVIAPNKNSLYGEYMPDYGVRAEESDASRLLAQLNRLDVSNVDLFAAFDAEDEILYFAHDSHWNSKGAALGADLINAAFGKTSAYSAGPFSEASHDGDLYAMLYPAFRDPETDKVYDGALNYTFTSKATRPDAIVLTTESEQDGSLLVYRDSFGNLLFPYLADSYGSARFSRSTTYDLTAEGDYVVIELVERNLRYLIANLPVTVSPQRQISLPQTTAGAVSVETTSRGDLQQVTGGLPQLDADSPIYVVCGDAVYEAFCLENNGFGVNLPEGATAQYVLCTANGQAVMYEIH